jgi:hypothetical protein
MTVRLAKKSARRCAYIMARYTDKKKELMSRALLKNRYIEIQAIVVALDGKTSRFTSRPDNDKFGSDRISSDSGRFGSDWSSQNRIRTLVGYDDIHRIRIRVRIRLLHFRIGLHDLVGSDAIHYFLIGVLRRGDPSTVGNSKIGNLRIGN